jgi:methyl-accepting chemotaxis protein PixJ
MINEAQNINFQATKISVASASNIKQARTLRWRLLTAVLPAVLVPLLIASTIGYFITERRSKTEELSKLKANSLLTSSAITSFFQNYFKIHNLVAANPDIIEAMRAANQQSQAQGLLQQPIEVLEKKFASTKLLKVDTKLNSYLKNIVKSSDLIEIFFTDRNGFNLAYSNPTSDFVQRDEDWWKISKTVGKVIDKPEFDQSAQATVFAFSKAVKDPQTQEFLGVIKAGFPITKLESNLAVYLSGAIGASESMQIINIDAQLDQAVISTITAQGSNSENRQLSGGEAILQAAQTMVKSTENQQNLDEYTQLISQRTEFSNIKVEQAEIFGAAVINTQLKYQDKIYNLATVPNTNLAIISAIDTATLAAVTQELLTVFALTALILGAVSLAIILLLAQQLSRPLTDLSDKTQEVAKGNLDVIAKIGGTRESRTLASNFNLLVSQVKNLLHEQTNIAEQQRQEKEKLELAIYTLIEEISDATDGDLTVRANLDSLELSTVADLFNAIISNLQDIAIEAKESSGQVGNSLKQNEQAIRLLAEQAILESQETQDTLKSVALMSQSIQAVAENASQAEKITDDTYNTIVSSTSNMDLTVNSILALRNTVGETAKKMKRLGESSQKISQVVSFIEEIALKTNVLAINASVEAGRAGEYGQGFTIVAEQVGALAEQSAAAIKEIASIVAAIQTETQEVNQAMESGTTQVVETTRLVETTKQSLNLVLEKSQEINQLMSSISQNTVSQADTSQNIISLMQKIAQLSGKTSKSSTEVAQSIAATAKVAAQLESTVGQFKVAE